MSQHKTRGHASKKKTPYKIGREIGHGATAHVYNGLHRETKMKVALKVIKPEFVEKCPQRISREVTIQTSCSHPNVIQMMDFYQRKGSAVMVMERGQIDLFDYSARHFKDYELLKKIVRDVATGLAHIHEQGFVHRDIKQENILMCKDPVAKITDFGLAISISEAQNGTQPLAGTREFLPPECFASKNVRRYPCHGFKFDIWSLGLLTLILLARRSKQIGRPLKSEMILAMRLDFKAMARYFDGAAVNFLRRTLEVDPKKRYSAKDCLKDQWLRPSPQMSRLVRAPKAIRKRRLKRNSTGRQTYNVKLGVNKRTLSK